MTNERKQYLKDANVSIPKRTKYHCKINTNHLNFYKLLHQIKLIIIITTIIIYKLQIESFVINK